jgi:hypothetical protein
MPVLQSHRSRVVSTTQHRYRHTNLAQLLQPYAPMSMLTISVQAGKEPLVPQHKGRKSKCGFV